MERFEATPLRVINEVGHAWGVRMGTRLQYDLCSHVYSHYPSTAKGSLLPPLWLKYHCRSLEKTIANAEAVHLLLSLWLRTDHSCINKEHIHIGENLRFTHTYIHTYIHIHIHTCMHAYMHTHTYIHPCMHACMHTDRQTDIQTYIHTYIHTCTHTYMHT